MSVYDTVAKRVERAYKLAELREGVRRITQEQIAKRVSTRLGEEVPQQAVGRWLKGAVPDTFDRMAAFSHAIGADPGWIYFGPGASGAPEPSATEDVAALLRVKKPSRAKKVSAPAKGAAKAG